MLSLSDIQHYSLTREKMPGDGPDAKKPIIHNTPPPVRRSVEDAPEPPAHLFGGVDSDSVTEATGVTREQLDEFGMDEDFFADEDGLPVAIVRHEETDPAIDGPKSYSEPAGTDPGLLEMPMPRSLSGVDAQKQQLALNIVAENIGRDAATVLVEYLSGKADGREMVLVEKPKAPQSTPSERTWLRKWGTRALVATGFVVGGFHLANQGKDALIVASIEHAEDKAAHVKQQTEFLKQDGGNLVVAIQELVEKLQDANYSGPVYQALSDMWAAVKNDGYEAVTGEDYRMDKMYESLTGSMQNFLDQNPEVKAAWESLGKVIDAMKQHTVQLGRSVADFTYISSAERDQILHDALWKLPTELVFMDSSRPVQPTVPAAAPKPAQSPESPE